MNDVLLAANHLLGVEGLSQSSKGGVVHASTQTENKVESRFLKRKKKRNI